MCDMSMAEVGIECPVAKSSRGRTVHKPVLSACCGEESGLSLVVGRVPYRDAPIPQSVNFFQRLENKEHSMGKFDVTRTWRKA